MFPLYPGRSVLAADPHGLSFRQIRIDLRAEQIVKGREAWSPVREEHGQILGMGVGIADQEIEDRPSQKGHAIGGGADAFLLQQGKTLL